MRAFTLTLVALKIQTLLLGVSHGTTSDCIGTIRLYNVALTSLLLDRGLQRSIAFSTVY